MAGVLGTFLAGIAPTPDWPDAACRSADPDLFFPVGETSYDAIAAAKANCATCPHQTDCLEWARPQASLAGIWGGQTEWDRNRARNRANGAQERSRRQLVAENVRRYQP